MNLAWRCDARLLRRSVFLLVPIPKSCYSRSMIRHTVVFKLKHPIGSQAELEFLQKAQKLAAIPTVKKFECLRQVSKKNNYDFGFSMEFASVQDYQVYNDHPDHVHFVQTHWIPEVSDFMEIDYEPYHQT
jgi:hypothetical protein